MLKSGRDEGIVIACLFLDSLGRQNVGVVLVCVLCLSLWGGWSVLCMVYKVGWFGVWTLALTCSYVVSPISDGSCPSPWKGIFSERAALWVYPPWVYGLRQDEVPTLGSFLQTSSLFHGLVKFSNHI